MDAFVSISQKWSVSNYKALHRYPSFKLIVNYIYNQVLFKGLSTYITTCYQQQVLIVLYLLLRYTINLYGGHINLTVLYYVVNGSLGYKQSVPNVNSLGVTKLPGSYIWSYRKRHELIRGWPSGWPKDNRIISRRLYAQFDCEIKISLIIARGLKFKYKRLAMLSLPQAWLILFINNLSQTETILF